MSINEVMSPSMKFNPLGFDVTYFTFFLVNAVLLMPRCKHEEALVCCATASRVVIQWDCGGTEHAVFPALSLDNRRAKDEDSSASTQTASV